MLRVCGARLERSILLGLLLCIAGVTIGCQEAIRTTLLDERVTGGELLEPVEPNSLPEPGDARDLGTASRMIVNASAQRWSDPKADQARREIVVSVMLLSDRGESIRRNGAAEFHLRVYDDQSVTKAGRRLAEFRADEKSLDRAWQGARLNRQYLFKLALRKKTKFVSREVFGRKRLFVVVEVVFRLPDGESVRALSAPIMLGSAE